MLGRMGLCKMSSQCCVESGHLSPELVAMLLERVVSVERSPSKSAVSHMKLFPWPLPVSSLRM